MTNSYSTTATKFSDYKLSFIEEITVAQHSPNEISLDSNYGSIPFKEISPGIIQAFEVMATDSGTKLELANMVVQSDGPGALPIFNRHFAQCVCKGLIEYAVYNKESKIVNIRLTFPVQRFKIPKINDLAKYKLSRFCLCRMDLNGLIIETPLSNIKMRLIDPQAVSLFSILCKPRTLFDIVNLLPSLPENSIKGIMQLLLLMDAISDCGDSSLSEEEQNDTLSQWEFHDLLFHSRSRTGRHNNPFGATFKHVGKIKPLPVCKTPNGDVIPLEKVNLGKNNDKHSLNSIMESRRSIRTYNNEHPITLKQLGEFFFRVARIKAVSDFEITVNNKILDTVKLSQRPYPTGGSIYELEMYLSVSKCQGLEAGFYHYNPLKHELTSLRKSDYMVETMLKYAQQAAGINHSPQVLITFAARFQRMSWKYSSLAYSAILKNVGVLYQTMYLVATDMGIAPCALGSGNSDIFAKTAETDYYVESSVGEFMLGSLPDSEEKNDWSGQLNFTPNPYLKSQV